MVHYHVPSRLQVWAGLRVRVGVHYGPAQIMFDESVLGYDYYGTVVNAASRIESVAHGGQVLPLSGLIAVHSQRAPSAASVPCRRQSSKFLCDQGQACAIPPSKYSTLFAQHTPLFHLIGLGMAISRKKGFFLDILVRILQAVMLLLCCLL